jgi:hypothetical protein
VATLRDLDRLALGLPQTTKEVSDDGRPTYLVHGRPSSFTAAAGPTRSIPRPASGWTTY